MSNLNPTLQITIKICLEDESRIDDIPQVFDVENTFLTTHYSEDEGRKTVFQSSTKKTLGLVVFRQSSIKTRVGPYARVLARASGRTLRLIS
jgi:L-2-hydroxyglutarate oxidase LhgO